MALPSTGKISLEQVRTELNKTGSISLGNTDVRNLAGKTSGIIKMSDLRGKSAAKILFSGQLTVGLHTDEVTYGFGKSTWGNYGKLNPNTMFGGSIVRFATGKNPFLGWYPYFQINSPKEAYPSKFITIFPDGSKFNGYIEGKGQGDFIFGGLVEMRIGKLDEAENQRLLDTFKKYFNQTIPIQIIEAK
jgi:hypothetical protein